MDDIVTFLVIVGAVVGAIAKTVGGAVKKLGQAAQAKQSQTPVELKLQRELEEYARRHRAESGKPAAPAARVTPAKTQAGGRAAGMAAFPEPKSAAAAVGTSGPAKPVPQPGRTAPQQAGAAAIGKSGPVTGARGRLRLNPRTMARVAILSEIWRPPLALRREEPWDRG